MFTQSEFQRFSGQDVTLGENQILLFDPAGTFPKSNTLKIDGKEFEIVTSSYQFPDASTVAQIYESYCMVVKDEKIIEQFLPSDSMLLGPNYSYDFDITGNDPQDIKAMAEALNTWTFSGDGIEYEYLYFEDSATSREEFMSLYGGLFFLGMFLGVLFLLGTALIIYYKQVSEGYEDAKRFSIMQKVGMSHQEVKRSIHSQILMVFFLPLLTAVIHLAFAFPMLQKILLIMGLADFQLILFSTLGCVAVFALAYLAIYAITARTYYNIVETSAD